MRGATAVRLSLLPVLAPGALGGYVQLNDTALLCSDRGMDVITSASECKTAAQALQLRNPSLSYNVGITGVLFYADTPYGCYYEDSDVLRTGLWFNPYDASAANGKQYSDFAICKQPNAGAYATRPGVHVINSFDGAGLTADSEVPVSTNPGEKFPLVIFINSWGVPEIEYLVKTIQWAKAGYICVEYQARGWYLSGGEIGTAGPDDTRDVSAVIDWALAKWPEADPAKVAVGGISYGGGIATLAAARDARVRAVVSMSGWSNIYEALNWHETPGRQWAGILVALGDIVGRPAAELQQVYDMLLAHQNMSFVRSWSDQRSALTFLGDLNKNNPAVYFSHNHGDNLFHSNLELDMWQRLTTPKRLDLSQGTHASAEIFGCLALKTTGSDHIWYNAKNWVDYHLKGIDNGVPTQPKVQMQVGNEGLGSGYVSFDTWPPSPSSTQGWGTTQYHLGARNDGNFGVMSEQSQSGVGGTDTISYSAKSDTMSTGVVLLSDFLKQAIPIESRLAEVNPQYGLVYTTGVVGPIRVCGVPRVSNLRVTPDGATFQVVTYLWSRDPGSDGSVGRLITHGVATVWNATAGQAYTVSTIDMHTCCFTVTAGQALALGVDMYDSLYKPANTNVSITIDYAAGGGPVVSVPVLTGAHTP